MTMAWFELQRSLQRKKEKSMIKRTTLFIFFAIIYNQGYILLVPNGYSSRQVCRLI